MYVKVSPAAALFAAFLFVLPSAANSSGPIATGPGCTVIYAADGDGAFGGNNEDGFNPLTKIWFVPGVNGGYGSVWVGYDDLVIQGGMNEAGLFFDGLAVREVTVPAKPGKPEMTGGSAFTHVMSECDSLDCVRKFYEGTSMPGTWNGQALFGDRFGNSAIVEPLTIVPKVGSFQVATNFFQSEVPAAERTDQRYVTATSILGNADRFSAYLMRDVLKATEQQGDVNTLYSTVYDLQARTVDLYYFMDFETRVTFDLHTELAKGIHAYDIPALFARNPTADTIAAPIRNGMAAAMNKLPEAAVTADDLARLTGTYQLSPSLTLEFMADDNVLMGRQAYTPWVPLRPLSATRFAQVFSDPSGAVLQSQLEFNAGDGAAATTVKISDGKGNQVVATRSGSPAAPVSPDPLLLVGAALAVTFIGGLVVGVVVFLLRRNRATHAAAE